MVARLEGTKDTSCVFEKLQGLGYDVLIQDKKTAFIYRKGSTSSNLRGDIRSSKDACKFNGTIKPIYGTTSNNM